MEAIAPLVHAFYSPHLSEADRHAVHVRLLASLSTDACVEAADAHIVQCAATLLAADAPSGTAPPDPLVLHYALHAIEARVRSGFAATPPSTRGALLGHLVDFVVAAFAWNTRKPAGQSSSAALPAHVVTKAARATVELGKREWVADATCAFPRVVLALVDQSGHTASSLPRIFAGMLILTVLVDDALDTSRADVLAADRAALGRRIGTIADGIVAALEIGLRISGPGLPSTVPAAAARTVGSLTRVAPVVASNAIAVLRRRSAGRMCCDLVGAETLGVLAELYGESQVALPGPWQPVLAHLADLLNPVAMGETARGGDEATALFRKRLTAYTEAVLCRCIAGEAGSPAMEHVLNGFMGATMRWAREAPSALPDALDAWICVLETVEDGEVAVNALLTAAFGALSGLCAGRCLFATNGDVLRAIESPDDETGEDGDAAGGGGEEDPEMLADMASRPAAYAAMATVLGSGDGGGDDGGVRLEGDFGVVTRGEYIAKCVEGLVAVARLLPSTVALQAAELSCRTLSSDIPSAASSAREALRDKVTAAVLAHSIAPLLPVESPPARMLTAAVASLFAQSPACKDSCDAAGPAAESWVWPSRLDVNLLRSAATLATTMAAPGWSEGAALASAFVHASRGILLRPDTSRPLAVAASLLLLTIGDLCRATVFMHEPPLPPSLVASTRSRAVAGLGAVGVARWALESAKAAGGKGGRGGAAADAWRPHMAALQQSCGALFADHVEACSRGAESMDTAAVERIARGSALAHSMFWCMYGESGDGKDAVWSAVGRQLCAMTASGLRELCRLASGDSKAGRPGEEEGRALLAAISTTIGAVGCALRVFRRQVTAEVPALAQDVIGAGLSAARGGRSPRLARALLTVLREQLGDGFSKDKEHLVAPAVDLAVQSMAGDTDVAAAAVGVLTESLTRHWLMFWPGDVALNRVHGLAAPAAPAPEAGAAVRKVYLAAFGGLVAAVRHVDAGVSREGMLALERIQAGRKLYSRTDAFRSIGGGAAATAACVGAMWSSPLVADEACAVVWGVGDADWNAFYGAEGSLIGAVRAIQACSDRQASALVHAFGQPTDRSTFARALAALVNDMRYTAALNKGPSM